MKSSSPNLKWLFVGIGIIALLGAVGLAGAGLIAIRFFQLQTGKDAALLDAERAADRIEAASAFRDPKPPTAEEAQEFEASLGSFFVALQNDAASAFETHFDFGRLLTEFERNGFNEKLDVRTRVQYSRAAVIQGVRAGFRKHSGALAEAFRWDTTSVRRVRTSVDGSEAVVIATHTLSTDEEPLREKYRWWLIRSGGGWKIYDFENLSVGMRSSSDVIRSVSPQALRNPGQLAAANDALMAAFRAIAAGELDEAESQLSRVRGQSLIRPQEIMRELGEAFVALHRGDATKALPHLESAERLSPEMPLAKLSLGIALNQTERYSEALVKAREYLTLLGPDCQGYTVEGTALEGLNRKDEAADAFRLALDDNPDDFEAFDALDRVIAADKVGDLAKRAVAAKHPSQRLLYAFNRRFHDDINLAGKLIEAYRTIRPDDEAGMEAGARVLAKQGKLPEGITLARLMYEKANPALRDTYLTGFLYATPEESAASVYRQLADLNRRLVFRVLTTHVAYDPDEPLSDEERTRAAKARETLGTLIDLHTNADPLDPWGDYQSGLLKIGRKEYAAADMLYERAESKLPHGPPKPSQIENEDDDYDDGATIRSARVHAWFEMGKATQALEKFGHNDTTFTQLAYRFEDRKNAAGLNDLLTQYATQRPDAIELPFWHGQVAWLQSDYATAAAKYQDYLRRRPANPEEGGYLPFEYMAVDRIVRSLVRAKREADAEAAYIRFGKEQPALKILVAASRGNVEKVLSEMKGLAENRWGNTDWVYRDEDIGPILKSDAFKVVRDAYPEPKPTTEPGPKK